MILLPYTLNCKHTVTVLLSSCNNKRKPQTRGCLAIYIKKYFKANKRIMEFQIFHHAKILASKKSSERNQNPSRYYYNSIITNLKFQHKPKYHLSKILI
jgi:hypothetical protein